MDFSPFEAFFPFGLALLKASCNFKAHLEDTVKMKEGLNQGYLGALVVDRFNQVATVVAAHASLAYPFVEVKVAFIEAVIMTMPSVVE